MGYTNLDIQGNVLGNVTGDVSGLVNTVNIIAVAGVPSAQATAKGTIVIDTTNANIYINVGTSGSPSYKLITRAA